MSVVLIDLFLTINIPIESTFRNSRTAASL
jgi:hypothetical protein